MSEKVTPAVVNISGEVSDNPPVVEIISPNVESFFGFEEFDERANQWFTIIPLQAVAFDEEDGELPARAMRWETNRDDLQDPLLGRGNGLEVRLYASEDLCAAEFHEITVFVVDSDGNIAQATIPVELRNIC